MYEAQIKVTKKNNKISGNEPTIPDLEQITIKRKLKDKNALH